MSETSTTGMHAKAVTLKDIAARCGFSKQTVSRALLRDRRISEATTQTILAMAEEMGYDPSRNVAARRMVLSQHGRHVHNSAIAFYTNFSTTQYLTRLLEGIWRELACQEHILVLMHSQHPQTAERMPLPSIFKSGDIDGTIVHELEYWVRPIVEEMRREPNYRERPVVSVAIPVEGTSSVLPDYREAGRLSAGHLLDLGHRHLLHFYAREDERGYYGEQRLQGYRDACRLRGLDPAQHLHAHRNNLTLEWKHERGTGEFLAFLRAHPPITAVLARYDLEALKLTRALRSAGVRVPEDISVVGFDDTDALYGEGGRNLLTSVRLPLEEIGRQAVQLVIREARQRAAEETHLVLPVELVARDTTAPPRKAVTELKVGK